MLPFIFGNHFLGTCHNYLFIIRKKNTFTNHMYIRPGASCRKVGSYFPMPGGLQCSMHWFPPPVNYPSQYDPGC